MATGVELNARLEYKTLPQIQFCSLGSGSKGNATLIRFDSSLILVDCGFSIKETVRRLSLKGVSACSITAILVTHEHSDHISGVAGLSNKYSIPVWLNGGTSLHTKCQSINSMHRFNSHENFNLGEFHIQPIAVPHDARESTQFILSAGGKSIGILTDVGHITKHMIRAYKTCDALLLEFNYDHRLLMEGKYPYKLKQRVSGNLGHLSNEQSVQLLAQMETIILEKLVAMHISEENNSHQLIKAQLNTLDGIEKVHFSFADQANGFEWIKLSGAINQQSDEDIVRL